MSRPASEPTILIVEVDPSFLEALTVCLRREGFVVHALDDGGAALDAFDEIQPDLVLLDVMLPTLSGIEICRAIRRRSTVPIVMVKAQGTEIDTVVGLEMGADDYITRPYRIRELVARMRAVLRRSPNGVRAHDEAVVAVGDVALDPVSHNVTVRSAPITLPLKEFELLAVLLHNVDRVLPRRTLMDHVWGTNYVGDTKTLDVHIKRLRSKIETDPRNPTRIVTIRGLGYKYQTPAAELRPNAVG